MQLAFLTCACLLLTGQPQPGSPAWFGQRGKEAETFARKSDEKEAMRVIQEMAKQAAQLRPEDHKEELELLTQWKKGVCEYWLGDLSQAIKTFEAIETKDKNAFFRHYLYIDQGDAFLDSGRAKKAEAALKKGLDLAAEVEKNQKRQFQPAELLRIKLQQVRCKISLSDLADAKTRLTALQAGIFEKKIDEATDEQAAELQAEWQILHGEVDLHERDLVSALKRLETAQKTLEAFPTGRKAAFLRFNCLLRLARDYWLLARHADARARLDLAEKLVTSRTLYRADLGRADLLNARAGLTIEETLFAVDDDRPAEQVLAELDHAEQNLRAALAQHDKLDRGPSVFTAAVEFHFAQVHEIRGRVLAASGQNRAEARVQFLEGKRRCDRALEQFRDVLLLPEHHDRVLEARHRRAWLNLRLGDATAAQAEGRAALTLFDKTHKKNDLDRGRYLHVLLEAEHQLGHADVAAGYAQEHRRLVDDGLATLVAGLSASEQIQFFRRWDTPGLNASLRLGIQHSKDDKIAAASVEWLINGKAKLAEVLSAQVKAVKHADRQVFEKFQKSIQRQIYLMYGRPLSDSASLQKEFLFEESTKRDLVKEAARQRPPPTRWYTLPEVRASLTQDELYVGIYCLRPSETEPRAYYAWLVSSQGPIHTVRLGDARTIDALVRVFVREQERAPMIAPGTEKQAEQELRGKCLDDLSRLVLHPIRKLAAAKKRWIISPDGPLWSIPWAALMLPENNRYAIEELTFRYAVTGQDLVPDKTVKVDVGAPLILGDPWFNHPGTDRLNLRQPGVDPLRLPWDRLEFSERECAAVAGIMESFRMKPTRLPGIMRKEQLSSSPRPPRIVYLATHAYATLPTKVQADDPLLSCALAFAGWNYLPQASEPALPGMMSGAELLGIDLRGTELVVLASCQTGAETLSYGQSPANLRHAFHLAGARAVVSALWSINDRSSMDVMEPFIESICDPGADKVEALHKAQQQSIRYLRMYRDHTHPFYWAGFTISGT